MSKFPSFLKLNNILIYVYLLHFVYPFICRWTLGMLPHAMMNMDVRSHQQCTRASFSLHPCQHLFSVYFFVAFLMGVKWCLIVVLSYIFIMISDVERLFHVLWPFVYLLCRNVCSSLSPFLNQVCVCVCRCCFIYSGY